jgi:cardiolipin synthase
MELLNRVPIWLVIITISRDVFISLIALVMYMTLGKTSFPPSFLGKLTTTAQVLTVAVILLANCLSTRSEVLVPGLIWASLTMTLISGFHYIYLGTRLANRETPP